MLGVAKMLYEKYDGQEMRYKNHTSILIYIKPVYYIWLFGAMKNFLVVRWMNQCDVSHGLGCYCKLILILLSFPWRNTMPKGICCNACTMLVYIWAVCGTKLSHRKSNISKAGFVDLYFVRDLEQ